jgi:hypothetical protein
MVPYCGGRKDAVEYKTSLEEKEVSCPPIIDPVYIS